MILTGGRWQLDTETSTYLVDLDQQVVVRVPDAGVGTHPSQRIPARVTALERDHEAVPLLAIGPVIEGDLCRMMLKLGADSDVVTHRVTTVVRRVQRL